ncbi:NADH-quinone oxidoreductase subunit 5 family protein [Picrophilus oshimae]|uniref:NADH-ubiquinone oxidoreductase chain 5 n=1 Tax=Picrophilus torridus (strain ATCC 700027 / DSM 9790 / JCM 10055 / NBRC 100828 / KAW 2/3) TaxID=1122961 RepID=A0A8G2FXI1_PICTO|nr:NADH-quinone oxidoreductase subunit L [Picrophilus oshimae]SMD31241.1 NADH dehydrogenase subunit L [Picrophilus oshimae DSM 9789]
MNGDSYFFIFISPLIAAPLEYILSKYYKRIAGVLMSLAILASFILSILAYMQINSSGIIYKSYQWFYDINFGIYIDHLSAIMSLFVSFVALMVNLYAMYYMKDDPRKNLYFAEIGIFIFSMLGLTVSSNLAFFFFFWEIVGFMSYILIGFWYFKPNAASAAKKAFIVTRVGDVLFIVGIGVLFSGLANYVSSPLSIPFIIAHPHFILTRIGSFNLTLSTALILSGAIAKSAQFPLHVWLPDSMEGPTTVSALIHAATMVAAGIYLVARLFPLFDVTSGTMVAVAIIGSFTAIFAGILGTAMNDIKRILAYSTISQLAYMLAALGLGTFIGYTAVPLAMFQLVVHGIFKALLFMAAGAIMIMTLENRDIRYMGGLFKRMPATAILMLIGSITLAGIPPTAGFYSKDTIVSFAYLYYIRSGDIIPWLLLSLGEIFTALYIFRMYFKVFLGRPRSKLAERARDPKLVYLIPVMVLAVLSLILGIFQVPFYHYIYNNAYVYTPPILIDALPLIYVVIGIFIAYLVSIGRIRIQDSNIFSRIVRNKFYLDRLFTYYIAQDAFVSFSHGISYINKYFIIDTDKAFSKFINLGNAFRKIQAGLLNYYMIFMIGGIAIVFLIVEVVRII